MKRAAGINEARSILTTWFGVEAADCDELLRTWSEQTQAPAGKLAAVLIHEIWEGEPTVEDRVLVRFLEERLRRLPVDAANSPAGERRDDGEAVHALTPHR
ncbi:hypothetical protein [Kribbella sp. NPDC049584]|uniref:hypothetical protein n=1 Tax=Kribbella sp. NPDC049584 TaxID=3154833 RepID=UPI00342B5BB0